MKTRVYHITYYEADRSAYVQFMGCNFACPWCIRRLTPWDHHVATNLNAEVKTLSLEELMSIKGIDKWPRIRKCCFGWLGTHH